MKRKTRNKLIASIAAAVMLVQTAPNLGLLNQNFVNIGQMNAFATDYSTYTWTEVYPNNGSASDGYKYGIGHQFWHLYKATEEDIYKIEIKSTAATAEAITSLPVTDAGNYTYALPDEVLLKVKSISLADNIESINLTLASFTALDEIVVGSEVTALNVTNVSNTLTTVNLSSATALTTIGANAFKDCAKLTNIDLSRATALTTIGASAFEGCGDAADDAGIERAVIPASVTTIGDSAFKDCNALTTVSFASGSKLSTLGTGVFEGCTALESVTLPIPAATDGYDTIPDDTFKGCTSLKSIVIPQGVATINSGAFADSGLEKVTIPSTVDTIRDGAFPNDVTVKFVGTADEWADKDYAKSGGIFDGVSPSLMLSNITDIGADSDTERMKYIGTLTNNSGNEVTIWCYDVNNTSIEAGVDSIVVKNGYNVFFGDAEVSESSLQANNTNAVLIESAAELDLLDGRLVLVKEPGVDEGLAMMDSSATPVNVIDEDKYYYAFAADDDANQDQDSITLIAKKDAKSAEFATVKNETGAVTAEYVRYGNKRANGYFYINKTLLSGTGVESAIKDVQYDSDNGYTVTSTKELTFVDNTDNTRANDITVKSQNVILKSGLAYAYTFVVDPESDKFVKIDVSGSTTDTRAKEDVENTVVKWDYSYDADKAILKAEYEGDSFVVAVMDVEDARWSTSRHTARVAVEDDLTNPDNFAADDTHKYAGADFEKSFIEYTYRSAEEVPDVFNYDNIKDIDTNAEGVTVKAGNIRYYKVDGTGEDRTEVLLEDAPDEIGKYVAKADISITWKFKRTGAGVWDDTLQTPKFLDFVERTDPAGTIEKDFEIKKRSLGESEIDEDTDEVTSTNNNQKDPDLVKGESVKVELSFDGLNTNGYENIEYNSSDYSNTADDNVYIPVVPYTGESITPTVTVKYGETVLQKNKDYYIDGQINKTKVNKPGEVYTVRVVTNSSYANYTGEAAAYWQISESGYIPAVVIPSIVYGNNLRPAYTGNERTQNMSPKYAWFKLKDESDIPEDFEPEFEYVKNEETGKYELKLAQSLTTDEAAYFSDVYDTNDPDAEGGVKVDSVNSLPLDAGKYIVFAYYPAVGGYKEAVVRANGKEGTVTINPFRMYLKWGSSTPSIYGDGISFDGYNTTTTDFQYDYDSEGVTAPRMYQVVAKEKIVNSKVVSKTVYTMADDPDYTNTDFVTPGYKIDYEYTYSDDGVLTDTDEDKTEVDLSKVYLDANVYKVELMDECYVDGDREAGIIECSGDRASNYIVGFAYNSERTDLVVKPKTIDGSVIESINGVNVAENLDGDDAKFTYSEDKNLLTLNDRIDYKEIIAGNALAIVTETLKNTGTAADAVKFVAVDETQNNGLMKLGKDYTIGSETTYTSWDDIVQKYHLDDLENITLETVQMQGEIIGKGNYTGTLLINWTLYDPDNAGNDPIVEEDTAPVPQVLYESTTASSGNKGFRFTVKAAAASSTNYDIKAYGYVYNKKEANVSVDSLKLTDESVEAFLAETGDLAASSSDAVIKTADANEYSFSNGMRWNQVTFNNTTDYASSAPITVLGYVIAENTETGDTEVYYTKNAAGEDVAGVLTYDNWLADDTTSHILASSNKPAETQAADNSYIKLNLKPESSTASSGNRGFRFTVNGDVSDNYEVTAYGYIYDKINSGVTKEDLMFDQDSVDAYVNGEVAVPVSSDNSAVVKIISGSDYSFVNGVRWNQISLLTDDASINIIAYVIVKDTKTGKSSIRYSDSLTTLTLADWN